MDVITATEKLKLQERMNALIANRSVISERIAEARALGDLKENAEYHAAKEEKAKMEARIAKIAGILENAVIIPEGEGDGTVANGSIVTLRYEGDDEDETERYLIGSIEERHDDLNVVSPTSPLGEALLGAAVGDVVGYAAPNGELRVQVVAVE